MDDLAVEPDRSEARELCRFLDAAPTPFHAVAEAAARLRAAGFEEVDEAASWPGAGRRFVARGGTLVAWDDAGAPSAAPFRLVGAHTDSPNLRVKPRPDTGRAGWRQLAVEVYGGPLLNSWLDRDLGLAGRVMVRGAAGPEARLLRIDRPVLRIPQLAIHLDTDLREHGLRLDRQAHTAPLWAPGSAEEGTFRRAVAKELGVPEGDVLAWDVMCHDLQPATLLGLDEDLVSSGRLDNLDSSWCALRALLERTRRGPRDAGGDPPAVPVVVLFDHEEVGSSSERGAAGPLLARLLERSVAGRGGGREELHRALSASMSVSADMAHATHPNYAERHEPGHQVAVNGGPVVKVNVSQRYATDAETEAAFAQACDLAGVPVQRFVNRNDLPCGSTIGPISAAATGVRTVDVGNAQLAMHSARELAGALDPAYLVGALTVWLS